MENRVAYIPRIAHVAGSNRSGKDYTIFYEASAHLFRFWSGRLLRLFFVLDLGSSYESVTHWTVHRAVRVCIHSRHYYQIPK